METDVPGGDRAGGESEIGGLAGGGVLVPVLDPTNGERAVDVGCTLAEQRDAGLVLVSPDAGSGTAPFPLFHGEGVERDERRQRLAERARETVAVPVEDEVRHGMRASQVVTAAAEDRGVDTVVVEQPAAASSGWFSPSTVDRITANAPCDVLVVNGAPPFGTVSSILLAVGGGPHSWLAAGVASDLAAAEGAWVDVVHVVPPDADDWRRTCGRQFIGTAMDRFGDRDQVDEWLHEAEDVVDALVEQSRYYDLTVLGAPAKSRLRRFVSGSTVWDVRRGAAHGVVAVHRAGDA